MQRQENSTLAASFRWKDRGNGYHYPKDMETRHLFYTLRMIWNHTAPEHLQLKPFKKYRFGPFYTAEYMRDAVLFLSRELSTRKDMEPRWVVGLRQITDSLRRDARALLGDTR